MVGRGPERSASKGTPSLGHMSERRITDEMVYESIDNGGVADLARHMLFPCEHTPFSIYYAPSA